MSRDRSIVRGSQQGDLEVWDPVEGRVTFSERIPGGMITQLAMNVSRSLYAYLVATRADDGEVEVRLRRWPFGGSGPDLVLSASGGIGWAVAVDADSRVAVVAGRTLGVWHVPSGGLTAQKRVAISGTSYQLCWRPGHDELVLVGDDRAVGFDPYLRRRWTVDVPYASSVAFSDDGGVMAIGSWERGIVGPRA